jgi:transcriptional regulator with XRE-family HTH domain
MTPAEFCDMIEAAGLTQESAAELLGVKQSTVFRWLNGETPISEEKATLIRERIQVEQK